MPPPIVVDRRRLFTPDRIPTPPILPEKIPTPPILYGPDGRALVADDEGGWYPVNPTDRPQIEGRWPSPSIPLRPHYPPGSEPRQFFPFAGYNISYVPRAEFQALAPFQILRSMADSCDVVRIVIEDVKQQLLGLEWDIHEKDHVSQSKSAESELVKQFLKRPDTHNDFACWLTRFLEELLVIDAPAVYRWRTVGGDPIGLPILDGSTIKPLIDFKGMPPHPPEAAYQQIIIGRVETEYTRPWNDSEPFDPDGNPKYELVYRPRNGRTFSTYGQSPVERVMLTLNLILRRQMHYLAWYTEGSVPEMFWKVPEEWTPSQIAQFQNYIDELLSGSDAQRKKVRMMPGGEGTGGENPRGHDTWSYEFEEYLIRLVAWAFQVSPLPIAKMMNRATSEQADIGETDAGMRPLANFVADFLTQQINDFLGYQDLHFIWTSEKASDENLTYQRNVAYVNAGIYTIDEVRAQEGLDATGTPRFNLAGQSMVLLGPEPRPLVEAFPEPSSEPGEAAGGPGPVSRELARIPRLPAVAGEGVEQGVGTAAEALAAIPGIPAAEQKAAAEDLRKWRKVALKAVKEGKRPREFKSGAIWGGLRLALSEYLCEARTPEDVSWAFRSLVKARRPLVSARRRIRLERRVRRACLEHFKDRAHDLAIYIASLYQQGTEEKVTKANKPDDAEMDRIMRWDVLAEALKGPLAEAYLDGETLAADAGGIEIQFGLTDEAATEYAEKRGAELLGMRVLEDGSIVPNPNARWNVSDTVRDQVKNTLTRGLEEGWTLEQVRDAVEGGPIWESRADVIARTEVGFALNRGTVDTYRGAGIEKVSVLDGPGCLKEGHDDMKAGVNGQRWSVEDAEEYPLGHPNCRRDFAPVMEE